MKYFLPIPVVFLAMMFAGCSDHNPNNVLNPNSPNYVGDSLAQLDANANGIADVLEFSSSLTISSGSSDSIASSSSVAISSSSLIASACAGNEIPISITNGYFDPQDTSQLCAAQGAVLVAVSSAPNGMCFDSWNALPSAVSYVSGNNATYDVIEVKLDSGDAISTMQTLVANFVVCPGAVSSSSVVISSSVALSSSTAILSSSSAAVGNQGDTLVIDGRDGQKYHSVKIGALVWMTENLRFAISGQSAPCAHIAAGPTLTASESSTDCNESGRYYTWAQAMDADESYNSIAYDGTVSQGICPEGWRLPTTAEYRTTTASVALDSTSVLQNGAFNNGLFNTGFYWTVDVSGAVAVDQSYCSTGNIGCGVAWIYHKGAAGYNQNNNKAEGLPLRCVR